MGIPRPAWSHDPVPTEDDSSGKPPLTHPATPILNLRTWERELGDAEGSGRDLGLQRSRAERTWRESTRAWEHRRRPRAPPDPSALLREVPHLPGPAVHSSRLSSGAVHPPAGLGSGRDPERPLAAPLLPRAAPALRQSHAQPRHFLSRRMSACHLRVLELWKP